MLHCSLFSSDVWTVFVSLLTLFFLFLWSICSNYFFLSILNSNPIPASVFLYVALYLSTITIFHKPLAGTRSFIINISDVFRTRLYTIKTLAQFQHLKLIIQTSLLCSYMRKVPKVQEDSILAFRTRAFL